jgi:protein TonB
MNHVRWSIVLTGLIGCFLWMSTPAAGQAQAGTEPNRPPSIPSGQAKQNLVTFVQPEYPALAKAARIVGIVHASIVVDDTGTVTNLRLVSRHLMLAPAAPEAVRNWKYRPFQVDGKTTAAQTEVQVSIPEP